MSIDHNFVEKRFSRTKTNLNDENQIHFQQRSSKSGTMDTVSRAVFNFWNALPGGLLWDTWTDERNTIFQWEFNIPNLTLLDFDIISVISKEMSDNKG